MTKPEDRDSYLPESTIIDRVVDTSDKIARFLNQLRGQATDERTRMHLDELIALQDELTTRIAEYRQKAPWQVSNTRVQYVEPGSGKVDAMIRDHGQLQSLNDATASAVALNNELISELEHVSINEGVEESREAFDNLQALVADITRKMSMDRSMAGDL